MEFKGLGLQVYTIKKYMQTSEDIRESFKKLSSMGYRYIQTAGEMPCPVTEYVAHARDAGLTIAGTHIPWQSLCNDINTVMDEHRIMNCLNVGISAMPVEYRTSKDGVNEFIKKMNGFADELSNNGFKLTYHNHSFEFAKIDGIRIMDMLVDGFNPDKISLVLDTHWVQRGGGDVIEWMNKLAGRIDILHLKDYVIVDNEPCFAEIMEGNMNFDGILKTASKIGVKWYVVEQDSCPGDPFDSVKISIENIKKYYESQNC